MTTPAPVTKEDVEAFCDACVSLRSVWEHYRILYEGSDLKRELLQTVAPTFFGDIRAMMVEHLVLKICAITDPLETMKRKNLTMQFLLANCDFSAMPGVLAKLEPISERIHKFRDIILPPRNRFISHLDLEAIRVGDPLGGAEEKQGLEFWVDLQDFLNIMHRSFINPTGQFYLNAMGNMSDADSLVQALRESRYFRDAMDDKEVGKRATDLAFKSKFYGAQ